jgi:hypothetical protein
LPFPRIRISLTGVYRRLYVILLWPRPSTSFSKHASCYASRSPIISTSSSGSVSTKGPKRPGFNLTFKLEGVTRTRHIRKQDLEKVRLMTARYKRLKKLIQKLSDLNWLILSRQSE